MGRVIKSDEQNFMASQLRRFARGELTWAELEGMTFEEAQALAKVGCELADAGRLEESRVIFEGLVEGNPKDAASQAALGTVYQKLGRTEEAMAAYSAALMGDPKHPVALAGRGELRLRSGDRQGIADLVAAIQADPEANTAAARRAQGLVKAVAMMAEAVVNAQKV